MDVITCSSKSSTCATLSNSPVIQELLKGATSSLPKKLCWVVYLTEKLLIEVTQRRTKVDFAKQMKDLVDIYHRDADLIRLVVDNLNIHTPAALYEVFSPQEAHRIVQKLEFHYTLKHASWLNQVEIELSVLSRQCLERRIPDIQTLSAEIATWEKQRNLQRTSVYWRFQTTDARRKMERLYPTV